mmetsp:Transcript_29624/g.96796  ORF Transcript_29624/g.96796 Transcript_29624/m.96796 type:complete len:268 (-) Transcript_29624:135-938(-)
MTRTPELSSSPSPSPAPAPAPAAPATAAEPPVWEASAPRTAAQDAADEGAGGGDDADADAEAEAEAEADAAAEHTSYPLLGGHFWFKMVDTDELVDELTGRTYTAYVVECTWRHPTQRDAQETWRVSKRYRDFEYMRKELKTALPGEELPDLPAKTLFSAKKTTVLKRRAQFSSFLETVFANPTFRAAGALQRFLDIPRKVTAAKAAVTEKLRSQRASLRASASAGSGPAAAPISAAAPAPAPAAAPVLQELPPEAADDPLAFLSQQ